MTALTRISRPNFYDFQRVSKQTLDAAQDASQELVAVNFDAIAGSGVLLDFPQEPVIFDSDEMDSFQQGLDAISSFDGTGILEAPYATSDLISGVQLAIEITDARLDGFVSTTVFILGKTFEDVLVYEVIELGANMVALTHNHFTEITNILTQNFRGNLNILVDGTACFDVGGRIIITEASSMRLTRDAIIDEQIREPDVFFANFKVANTGKTLQTVLQESIGSSNDVDDLDVNTTAARTRMFEEGGAPDVIYGQKFLMNGDNIQKITLLLSLEAGSTWSGTLILGLRSLQTSTTSTTDFLPDDDIGFDPSTEPLEEIAIDQADLEEQGVILDQTPRPVDFIFTGSNVSNPTLSGLSEGAFYAITIRRAGSTTTGTIVLQEARNSNVDRRLTVFDSDVWTDIEDSTMWYRVWGDAARVTSGVAYDDGVRLVTPKTIIDSNGTQTQNFTEDYDLVNTGEDAENYVLVQKSVEFTDEEAHPRTGDAVFSRKEDAPSFVVLEQTDVFTLIDANDEPVLLGRIRDRNPRSNPTITGTTSLPGLALGNVFTVIDPGSDLLTQNVVGSIITPNINKPNLRYRIISQTLFTDLYGDTNLDELIDVVDAARIAALDGYAPDLSSGTVLAATQLAAVLNGATTVAELLRADVDASGDVAALDVAVINAFIDNGTAMAAGSSFNRIELAVEPLTDPQDALDIDATSILHLEDEDPDFIDNTTFSALDFSIAFLPTWYAENLEVLDLRRYVTTTFLDFTDADLQSSPETGGKNSLFVPGDLVLGGSVLNIDNTFHSLDYEENQIEIELPNGSTSGEVDVFNNFVVGSMMFSDGTLVASSAINDHQIKFLVSISSYAKQLDGYDFDTPVDGYAVEDIDEVIGTYIDHDTGLLRLYAKNIVNNPLLPQIRTRITIIVKLKKAGFQNTIVQVNGSGLATYLL